MLRDRVLRFMADRALPELGPGRYTYSRLCSHPTLYSSTYAAMTLSLFGEPMARSAAERAAWVAYLSGHQDDDGLFRDPAIYGQGWYAGDPLWCGRPHLSCHVLAALTCLGAVAPREIRFLDSYRDADRLLLWLESSDWAERVAWTGNEIMNVGTLLQYSRDFHGDSRAGGAVDALLEWLSTHHIDASSGVWGDVDLRDPIWRSHAVQAAYHWWPLFLYDSKDIPHIDRAIDTVLATQNPAGGYGWGVHNKDQTWDSSACEDIDSVHPLAAFSVRTSHRREEIRASLERAAPWILSNQCQDGGFTFMRDRAFEYGHRHLSGPADGGAMFPTWFRVLSLAYIAMAVPSHPLAPTRWHFVRCPGVQFWDR